MAPPVLTRVPPAAVAFTVYIGAALVLGECYPLSRFPMYALSGYSEGGVLVLRADGQEGVDLHDLVAFEGIDPQALRYPDGHHFASEYLLDAMRHHIETHPVTGTPAGAPLHLEIGLRIAEAGPDGPRVTQDFLPMAEGRAWSRP